MGSSIVFEELILQRDFFVGWVEAVALLTEKCGFTSEVGKIEPLPTSGWNGIRLHFSLVYENPPP
jgi:hypothetical protein